MRPYGRSNESAIMSVVTKPSGEGRMILNIGPSHPATHGALQVIVELEGETILRADPVVGYLHRGVEKLAEGLTYHQFIPYTDRLNYVSSFMNNVAYCLAVEKLVGIEAPERAQALRVILSEMTRIMDHMVALGANVVDVGAFTPFLYMFNVRENAYDIFEACCGARLTVSYCRVGGLSRDVPENFEERVEEFCDLTMETLGDVEKLLNRNRIFLDRTVGVGAISQEEAISYGFTGPNLRATGKKWDIRKAFPYLTYDRYDFEIPTRDNGDSYDRYIVRMEEMKQSVRIIRQALADLPGGRVIIDDFKHAMPDKTETYNSIEGLIHHFKQIMYGVNPPKGEAYSAIEAANGELGFYLVSDGSGRPYRLRIRPPCFIYYQAFEKMIKGQMIADLIAILGSINVVAGELDR